MRIKVEQFCSLATSPSWQAWLYHFNADLYRKFIKRLQESRGCSQNRELMTEILQEIDSINGGDALGAFLAKHYPHMIDGPNKANISKHTGQVFEYYNPNILTYPRRVIFTGDIRSLKRTVNEFVLDKIKHDSIIVGNTAYVEYLTKEDMNIADKIPNSNWQIPAYRLRTSGKQNG